MSASFSRTSCACCGVISLIAISTPPEWSTGVMDYWSNDRKNPALHYSTTPIPHSASHSHDIVTRIDMHHFAGHGAAPVAAEKQRGLSDLFGFNVAFERRSLAAVMKHILES